LRCGGAAVDRRRFRRRVGVWGRAGPSPGPLGRCTIGRLSQNGRFYRFSRADGLGAAAGPGRCFARGRRSGLVGHALQGQLDRALGGLLSKVLASEKFEGKPGQLSYVHTGGKIPAERVLVVGLGPHRRSDRTRADAEPMRRAVSAAMRRARDLGAATVAVFVPPDGLSPRERAQAIVEGGLLGTYRFEKYLKEKNGKAVRALTVLEPDRRSAAGGRDGVRPHASPATW